VSDADTGAGKPTAINADTTAAAKMRIMSFLRLFQSLGPKGLGAYRFNSKARVELQDRGTEVFEVLHHHA